MYETPTTTIYVADLPVKKDENGQPQSTVDKEFLQQLFQDQGVTSADAITIKTKIERNGNPRAFAFIRFESHEQAVKAINELNYTKLNGVPIRLILHDEKTMKIIKSRQRKLLIKNLDPDIEASQLHDAFSNFGEIIYCKIPTDVQMVPKADGSGEMEKKYVSRGYGYVQFRNPEDAKQAMTDLKDASINGRPVEIQPFCRRQHQNPENTFCDCYIKNFPKEFTEDDVKALFQEYGTPVSCKISTDENGNSEQFGYCSMDTHENAVRAVKGLNGKEIDGMTIMCGRAMSKQERLKELQTQSEKWRKANHEKYKGRNLYVRNFDETVTDDELKEIFSRFGTVESAKVMRDNDGNSKKFGFVCFATEEEANKCLKESPLILIRDKQAYVTLAMSREQRLKQNLAITQQRRTQASPNASNTQNQIGFPYGNDMQFSQMPGNLPYAQPAFNGAPGNIPFPQHPPVMPSPPNAQSHPEQTGMFQPPIAPPFGNYPQQTFYPQDTKAMSRSEIMEKHPNNSFLLQRLRDMSDDQARELASDQEFFTRWMEQAPQQPYPEKTGMNQTPSSPPSGDYCQHAFYSQDSDAKRRNKTMENPSNSSNLLQRLHDLSDDQSIGG